MCKYHPRGMCHHGHNCLLLHDEMTTLGQGLLKHKFLFDVDGYVTQVLPGKVKGNEAKRRANNTESRGGGGGGGGGGRSGGDESELEAAASGDVHETSAAGKSKLRAGSDGEAVENRKRPRMAVENDNDHVRSPSAIAWDVDD